MTLTLSTLRCPDSVAPESRRVTGGEFSIGRGPDNDWTLPDPERFLSKRHCLLSFRSGGWEVTDLSSNGTFLNRDADPIGVGEPRPLRTGDRLRFGSYEVDVTIVEDAHDHLNAVPARPGGAYHAGATGRAPSLMDPFADDPAPPRPAFGDEHIGNAFERKEMAPDSIRLPADYDPLAPDDTDDSFRTPTVSDHAPSLDQAFRPPPVTPGVIPDDWDLDLPGAVPAKPSVPPPPAERAPPLQAPLVPVGRAATTPTVQPVVPSVRPEPVETDNPFDTGVKKPVPSDADLDIWDDPIVPDPPAAPTPVPVPKAAAPVARQPATPAAGPAPGDSALLAAFLRGAGVSDASPPDPMRTMEALGAALRALVAGLRQALIARATIKGEFRIEQTMVRASGNNPLKFAAGDDDALAALLGVGRRTDVAPAAAVTDALRDMRLHELATVSAMQTAVRALLADFEPAAIAKQADQGGFNVLPAQKKARQWDAFEAHHTKVFQALSDDFDSVFGKAFARAYEQAMQDISAKEGSR